MPVSLPARLALAGAVKAALSLVKVTSRLSPARAVGEAVLSSSKDRGRLNVPALSSTSPLPLVKRATPPSLALMRT